MRRAISGLCALALACDPTASPPPSAPAVTPDAAVLDATPPDRAPVLIPETAPARRMWTHELADRETFEAYSRELGGERFAKFVIDVRTNAIYYFDVNVYPVHKDFVFGELYKKPKTKQAVRVFDRNYTANKADFMLCYLVHHRNQDVWTMAFWDGDKATAAQVTRAYKRMKETFFLGDKVRYRPDSNYQEAVAKQLTDVPVVLNDELYKLADYTAFNKGVAIGRLRIVTQGDDTTFAVDDIVVLAAALSDITPVAAIIAETFSSPTSPAREGLGTRTWVRGASQSSRRGRKSLLRGRDSDYCCARRRRDVGADARAAPQDCHTSKPTSMRPSSSRCRR